MSIEELVEWLRDPAKATYLAVLIALHDNAVFHRVHPKPLNELLSKLLIPKENAISILRKLEEKGLVEVKNENVYLTELGAKVVELARWGRKI